MILEDETFRIFGYYPSTLLNGSGKPILAACDTCGKIRKTSKNIYRRLCKSCTFKGDKKPKVECTCLQCSKIFEVFPSNIKYGGGKYCCLKCRYESQKGEKGPNFGNLLTEETKVKISVALKGKKLTEETKALMSKNHADFKGKKHPNYKGGKKMSDKRYKAKRRKLGSAILTPLKEGEDGHHVTNEYVIGIPSKVHNSIGGRRKLHRIKVLQWLKINDKKKYDLVLSILVRGL